MADDFAGEYQEFSERLEEALVEEGFVWVPVIIDDPSDLLDLDD